MYRDAVARQRVRIIATIHIKRRVTRIVVMVYKTEMLVVTQIVRNVERIVVLTIGLLVERKVLDMVVAAKWWLIGYVPAKTSRPHVQ